VKQKTAPNLPASHTFQLPTILLLAPPPPPLPLTCWNARFPYFCSSSSGMMSAGIHTGIRAHQSPWLLTRRSRCRIHSCDATHKTPWSSTHLRGCVRCIWTEEKNMCSAREEGTRLRRLRGCVDPGGADAIAAKEVFNLLMSGSHSVLGNIKLIESGKFRISRSK